MDMSIINSELTSLRQALGTAVLRKAMNQDTLAVTTMLQDMQKANAQTMEASVTPHLGSKIDVYA